MGVLNEKKCKSGTLKRDNINKKVKYLRLNRLR